MTISKLRTRWLILISALYTAYHASRVIGRQFIGTLTRPWVDATIQTWAKGMLGLVGVQYKIINPHQVSPQASQPTIIMCNHSSLYDIPLSFITFPNNSVRMLSKKELSKVPLMGKAMKKIGFPFIDRKNKVQAIKDLSAVRALLAEGIVLWIAPEGTRSKDGKLATFKKGGFITAIETQATIIPIGIRGATEILPARTLQLNLNQTAEIHVGQPISANQYSYETRNDLMEIVHQAIKNLVEDSKPIQENKS